MMNIQNPRDAASETYLKQPMSAQQVAEMLDGKLIGSNLPIQSVSTYWADLENTISYNSNVGATQHETHRTVICSPDNVHSIDLEAKIIVQDPRKGFLSLLQQINPDFNKTTARQFELLGFKHGPSEIHPSAVIEDGVIIGDGCVIEPNVTIKCGTIIGHDTYISANSVLGTEGPAIYTADTHTISYKRLHYGTLQILNNVEIGTGCVLLKAMLGRTKVGANTILGNLVHIGHGCAVENNVWIAANATVCGHAIISSNSSIGAGAVIRDNLFIGEHASVGMGSVVVKDVQPHTTVVGNPARAKEDPESKPLRGN